MAGGDKCTLWTRGGGEDPRVPADLQQTVAASHGWVRVAVAVMVLVLWTDVDSEREKRREGSERLGREGSNDSGKRVRSVSDTWRYERNRNK